MKSFTGSIFLALTINLCSIFTTQDAFPKDKPNPSPRLYVREANSPEEKEVLSNPFVGVTVDGNIHKGLFPILSTGISTSLIRKSVQIFLDSLSEEQRNKCTFPIDDDEWRKWNNIEIYQRQGIGLFELTATQKELAYNILKESLSVRGLKKVKNVMVMEEQLAYLIKKTIEKSPIRDRALQSIGKDQFYFTFMGKPTEKEPWGWQIDGHHLVINFFVLDDQVVMTPTFLGSEPTYPEEGPAKGLRTFEEEETKGLQFYSSLTPNQKEKVTLWKTKDSGFNQAEAFRDNAVISYSGIPGSELTDSQKVQLLDLIEEYVGNLRDGHAQIKMEEVKTFINETWFSWIGEEDGLTPFYYRIQSPVIYIEFDHQGPVFLWDRSKPRPGPVKNHIHTVVRTPNGNDYGKDILRQHLEQQHKNKFCMI